jgi:hypothetical protein
MPHDTESSDRAFQELIRVLEGALDAGVTTVKLEYKDRDLVVFYCVENTGLGASCIAADLKQAVINELVKRARPFRKSRGKMPVRLLGKDCEVLVERFDSFGESAYRLTVKERGKKAGR